jgi:dihydroneopterin aldolase/D-erythro-7,8-dihydroneopterin triphosphate epimerase
MPTERPRKRTDRSAARRAGRRPSQATSLGQGSDQGPAEAATILIRGLAARTFIGITADERAKRQDITIDLALQVNTRAGRTDRIEDAVDYKTVKDAVLDYVEETDHDLLEALAQGIADLCLVHSAVEAVEVEVDKPGALRFARSVAVRIRRTRQAGQAGPGSGSGRSAVRTWGHRG